MVEIFVNDSLKIIQDKNNKTMYKMEFNYPCPALIRSLTKTHIIQGTITDDYTTLRFKALSLKSFPKFIEEQSKVRGTHRLSINLAANMISNLSAQLSHLIKSESKTIIGYAPENIIVINDNTFAFLDSELVAEIDPVGKEMATISCPFKVTDFFASPEILKITELPSYVHYKTSYFSLGCLLLYALTEGRLEGEDFYKEYLKELKCEKIHEYLTGLHFKNTKLYWLLSRCLVEEPKKRSILFI
jgi:serine/threonine protein kinase